MVLEMFQLKWSWPIGGKPSRHTHCTNWFYSLSGWAAPPNPLPYTVLATREASVETRRQGCSWSHCTLKDVSWWDTIKRYAEVYRGQGGLCSPQLCGQVAVKTSDWPTESWLFLMLAYWLKEVRLCTDHSSLDLSASNSLAKRYAWLLRFPDQIQIISHASASGGLASISL